MQKTLKTTQRTHWKGPEEVSSSKINKIFYLLVLDQYPPISQQFCCLKVEKLKTLSLTSIILISSYGFSFVMS
jgi:hypothetical protein